MGRSGAGSVVSFGLATLLPVIARIVIGGQDYSMWALLASVGTVATSLDFGGASLLGARLESSPSAYAVFRQGAVLTMAASAGVTALALGLWLLLGLAHQNPVAIMSGLVAMALMGTGTLLRSIVTLDATVAMVADDYRAQTRLYIAQACAQVMVAGALLAAGLSYWALPIAAFLSSGTVAVAATRWRRRQLGLLGALGNARPTSVRQFAAARAGGSLMLLAFTQGDRWLVGAVAGPGMLGTYDLASRAAAIPKFVAAALSGVVLPQRARLLPSAVDMAQRLYRDAQRVVCVTVGGGTVILAVGAATAAANHWLSAANLGLLIVLLLAHAGHALTITGAMFLTGRGRPELELPSIALGLIVFCLAGVCSFLFPIGPILVLFASPLALCVEATSFLYRRPWL